MAQRIFFCGTSRAVHHASQPVEQPSDGEAPRLSTALHFPAAVVKQLFRVIALLPRGGSTLLCLESDRETALARARRLLRDVPADATALCLQCWVGTVQRGSWLDRPYRQHELPFTPRRLSWNRAGRRCNRRR